MKALRDTIVAAEAASPAEAFEAAFLTGIVGLAAAWTPDALGTLIGQAMELAALEGREAVFAEIDGRTDFAEPEFDRQPFREQIDFLTQKRPTVSRVWTDFMRGQHDRALVVAGVTDQAMIDEFATAIIDAARTYDRRAFAAEFDRLVEKYGWSYNGGREWRIRTIFETNIRTSYMAGRLKQMRDPDVVKLRPYWQYVHAATRMPLVPREQHVAWDGLVLMWDDPWWDVYYPPNDWKCSCGVRTLSAGQLKRMGKTGPDPTPEIIRHPHLDKASGQTVMQPEGTGFGWDYMPGDRWDRGLVPEMADVPEVSPGHVPGPQTVLEIAEGGAPAPEERVPTMAELRARANDFRNSLLPAGLEPEVYAAAFLREFDLDLDQRRLWRDPLGHPIIISQDLFRTRFGQWKALQRGHGTHALLLAEALKDPDEIWLNAHVPRGAEDEVLRRNYIRVSPDRPLLAVFELGRRMWWPITGYGPLQGERGDFGYLDRQRRGQRIWWRK